MEAEWRRSVDWVLFVMCVVSCLRIFVRCSGLRSGVLKNINKYEKMRSSCCCEGIPCMHFMQRLDVYVFVKSIKLKTGVNTHTHTHTQLRPWLK